MAFNPFHAFQKNKKFWMAAILLVTMITFVFCTGQGGDMQDRLIRMFSRRGTTIATVGSYNLSHDDLIRLRGERNKVNEFMLKCCRITADSLTRHIMDEQKKPVPTDEKKRKESAEMMVKLEGMQLSLLDRLRPRPGETQPRYFEGGVKFDDLIEFKIWQVQADRLGIRLETEDVNTLLRLQFFSTPQQMLIDNYQIADAQGNARGSDTSPAEFFRALTEEFRVRIARLAMLEMQALRFRMNQPFPYVDSNVPDQERAHITLNQIWKVYQEKRSELEVTLIPVHVDLDDFGKEVFDQKPPTDAELEKLFEKYRKEKYDPASPLPSFESPPEVKVEFIMADPTSPLYMGSARAKMALETTLPLIGSPLQSPLVAAARAGALAAAKQKNVADVLEGMTGPNQRKLYRTADLGSADFIWPMAGHFAQKEPTAAASLVGSAAASLGDPALGGAPAFAGYLNIGANAHAAEIEAGIAAEAKRRTLPYATIAASGAFGTPGGMAATAINTLKLFHLSNASSEIMLLPMPIIERDLENVLVNRTAEAWATRNLLAVKKQLDKTNNKPEAVKRVINELPKDIIHVITKGYYNRYTIDAAPELQPLKEAYEKYYTQVNWFEKRDITPDRMLKDSDFYKLFFENERFSSTGKYQVRPWPPEVFPNQLQVRTLPGMHTAFNPNIDQKVLEDVQQKMQHQDLGDVKGYKLLDKAQKPILFWRADDKAAEIPQTLAAARDRVLKAWKIEKARELKALPLARKIAEDLLGAQGEYTPRKLREASEAAKSKPILIPHVAPLAPTEVGEKFRGRRVYLPYQLPKDTVTLPRDDMVAELLSLYGLKQPIKLDMVHPEYGEPTFVKELNDVNKALFDKAKKENKPLAFVQVLTNKPQNTYYVAVVTQEPRADRNDFKGAITDASDAQFQFEFRPADTFVTRAQEILARQLHDQLLIQLREEIGYKNNFETKDRIDFDKNSDTGS